MNDVLVLDQNWIPSGFCSWENAVKLIWEDRAILVKEDEAGRILRSPSFSMGMPRVIAVKNAWTRRKRPEVPYTRRNLAIRDNSTCQYCNTVLQTEEYTIDHVIPRSRGGLSTWSNSVLACVDCNYAKADMTPKEARMTLLKAPVAPKANDPKFNFKLRIRKLRPEWKEWESWLYWNIELDR